MPCAKPSTMASGAERDELNEEAGVRHPSGSSRGALEDERRQREGGHQFPFCSVILEATPQQGIALRKSGGGWHTCRPAMEMMDPGSELGRSLGQGR